MLCLKLTFIVIFFALISISKSTNRLEIETSVQSSSGLKTIVFSGLSWDGSKMFIAVYESAEIWNKQPDGNFQLAQRIMTPNIVFSADFSRNSELLAIPSSSGIEIWKYNNSTSSYGILQTITSCHSGEIYKIRITDDGKRIISGGDDGNFCLLIFDNTTGMFKQQQKVKAHEHLTSLAVNSGNVLVTVGSIMTLKRWTFNNSTQLYELAETVFPLYSTIYELDLSQDDSLVVGGDYDGGIQVASLNPNYELVQELYNHTKLVTWVRISKDKRFIISVGNDSKVALWTNEYEEYTFTEGVRMDAAALSIDSNNLVALSSKKSLTTFIETITNCPQNSLNCPCPALYLFENGICRLDCNMLRYTVGFGDTNQCLCAKDHYWVQVSKRCFVNCSTIPYSTGVNTGAYTCECNPGRQWVSNQCLINCTGVENTEPSHDKVEYQEQCRCKTFYHWNQKEGKCTLALGIVIGIPIGCVLLIGLAVGLGVYFWRKKHNKYEIQEDNRSRSHSSHLQPPSHTEIEHRSENSDLHSKQLVELQPPKQIKIILTPPQL